MKINSPTPFDEVKTIPASKQLSFEVAEATGDYTVKLETLPKGPIENIPVHVD